MNYIPTYFTIQELVPEQVFVDRGEKAWQLFDDRLLITIDRLRERFGQATINNWSYGGNREWSGLRTPHSPYYSPYSQHTFGRAADMVFRSVNAERIRREILAMPDEPIFEYITAIELNTSWLHIDCRNCDRLYVFKP